MRDKSVIDSIDDYKSAVYLCIYRGGGWTLYKLISRANSVNLANNRSTKLGILICSAHARTIRPTDADRPTAHLSAQHMGIKHFDPQYKNKPTQSNPFTIKTHHNPLK
jgi:hypothetical protein